MNEKAKKIASALGWVGLGCQITAQYLLAHYPTTALWVMLISGLIIVIPTMWVTKNKKMLFLQVVYTYFRVRTLVAWS